MNELDQKVLFGLVMHAQDQARLLLEMAVRILDLEKMVTKLLEDKDAA